MAFNILVVDDSKIIRDVIAKTLRLAGVPVNEIYQADNGHEALAILEREWIDLLFTDINMPIMGGVELIESIRSLPPWLLSGRRERDVRYSRT